MRKYILSLSLSTVSLFLVHSNIYATDLTLTAAGRVSVEFIFSEAGFSNTLSITTPNVGIDTSGCSAVEVAGLPGIILGSEKVVQRGCRVELDADTTLDGIQGFNVGDILQFSMCAQTDADTDCEYIWQSNPADNSDSFDHLQTTPILATEYPGKIFQLAWEDFPNGGDNDFNDLIVNVRVANDTDGDGLWDDWETDGIDTNGDGVIDFDLPNLLPVDLNGDGDTLDAGERVSPDHKDLFVEIDYMDCAIAGGDCVDTHSHEPKQDAIDLVVAAFNNKNITLRVDVDDAIAHQNQLDFDGSVGTGDFDDIKTNSAIFGINNPRRYIFHYAIFSHRKGLGTESGSAERPGNDLYVSLGEWNTVCIDAGGNGILDSVAEVDDLLIENLIYTGPNLVCDSAAVGDDETSIVITDKDGDGTDDRTVGTIRQQAGTLMHELGHNLSLHHGGGDVDESKPNYLSVMNKQLQMEGVSPPMTGGIGRLDFSTTVLPVSGSLDETNLDESIGIQSSIDSTYYFCPDGSLGFGSPAGAGSIDWNCDGDSIDTNVVEDINLSGTHTILSGYEDWSNLVFDFHSFVDFEDGVHNTQASITELDIPAYFIQRNQVITIDLKPGNENNPVNTGSNGKLTVAILSRIDLDVTRTIDISTLTFGHSGDEDSLHIKGNNQPNCSHKDVNEDGFPDLVCHFHTNKTSLTPDDTLVTLKGKTVGGINFRAQDSINTKPSEQPSPTTSQNTQQANEQGASEKIGSFSLWYMLLSSLIFLSRRKYA